MSETECLLTMVGDHNRDMAAYHLRCADQFVSDGYYDNARESLREYDAARARAPGFEPRDVAGTIGSGDKFAAQVRDRLIAACPDIYGPQRP